MTAVIAPRPKAEQRPYRPFGAAMALMTCRANEVLLSGPAGTGKSRACLEKLHLMAENYPGMRGLIVRKTRESLSESALVTYEEKVLPVGHGATAQPIQRRVRQAYQYPNGSTIVVGGLDKPSKVMSTEYDAVYIQEATELVENDLELLSTRLRNGKMPYQQIIADCNPGPPTHWLKRRADAGRIVMLESRHEDNPTVTPEYLARLDALTGVRKLRLRKGIWAAAEGVIYEEWNAAIHLVDHFEPPGFWPRFWVVDFGFTNPFVWQAWAEDTDGRLFMYREIYMTGRIVEDHARAIQAVTANDSPPVAIICDHDAEDRATLARHLGIRTYPARKAVSPGIQAVKTRLRSARDHKPRLFLMRGALIERDPALEEAKRPMCTVEEFDSYIWDKAAPENNKDDKPPKEAPVKRDDHGMDAMRYLIAHIDGLGRAGAASEQYDRYGRKIA